MDYYAKTHDRLYQLSAQNEEDAIREALADAQALALFSSGEECHDPRRGPVDLLLEIPLPARVEEVAEPTREELERLQALFLPETDATVPDGPPADEELPMEPLIEAVVVEELPPLDQPVEILSPEVEDDSEYLRSTLEDSDVKEGEGVE